MWVGVQAGAAAVACLCASVFAQSPQTSAVTVNELLRMDNTRAAEKARDEFAKSGLVVTGSETQAPAGAARAKVATVTPPQWSLRSVYGQADQLRVDVSVDGVVSNGLPIGGLVAGCRLKGVEGACMALVESKGKAPKSSARCPAKTCWSGVELAEELRPRQSAATPGGAGQARTSPLPPPAAPLPQTVGGSAPEARAAVTTASVGGVTTAPKQP